MPEEAKLATIKLDMVEDAIDPPVMETLFEFCTAIVPRPVTEVVLMEMAVELAAVSLP